MKIKNKKKICGGLFNIGALLYKHFPGPMIRHLLLFFLQKNARIPNATTIVRASAIIAKMIVTSWLDVDVSMAVSIFLLKSVGGVTYESLRDVIC